MEVDQLYLQPNYIRDGVSVIDVDPNTQPEEWRREIFNIQAAGQVPLTAIMNALPSETISSRIFHWWVQKDNEQRGDILGIYTKADLTGVYVENGADGDTLYIRVPPKHGAQIVAGHTIAIINAELMSEVAAHVTAVYLAGEDSSYLAVELLEDDTDDILALSETPFDVDGVDKPRFSFWIIGDAQAEMAPLPDPLAEEPHKFDNQTEIFAEAIAASGTKLAEVERITPEFWTRQRAAGLMRLRKRMEKAAVWGIHKERYVNGKQVRFTQGLVPAIKRFHPENMLNFRTDPQFAGKTWNAAGIDFFFHHLERLFRYSTTGRKLVFAGHAAMKRIQDAIMDMGGFELKTRQTDFGITVTTIWTVFGPVDFVSYPMFTHHESRLHSALITEVGLMQMCVLRGRDLKFLPDVNKDKGGFEAVDGIKEGWRIETGFRYYNLEAQAYVTGIGMDNIIT